MTAPQAEGWYIENPEAVGDPDQTPRVRLFKPTAGSPLILDRESLKAPLHQVLHGLDVRMAKVTAEGCHCNLVAEVALDVIMPLVSASLSDVERRVEVAERERDEAREQATAWYETARRQGEARDAMFPVVQAARSGSYMELLAAVRTYKANTGGTE